MFEITMCTQESHLLGKWEKKKVNAKRERVKDIFLAFEVVPNLNVQINQKKRFLPLLLFTIFLSSPNQVGTTPQSNISLSFLSLSNFPLSCSLSFSFCNPISLLLFEGISLLLLLSDWARESFWSRYFLTAKKPKAIFLNQREIEYRQIGRTHLLMYVLGLAPAAVWKVFSSPWKGSFAGFYSASTLLIKNEKPIQCSCSLLDAQRNGNVFTKIRFAFYRVQQLLQASSVGIEPS